MESRSGHRSSAEAHGIEYGRRRHSSRPPHGELHFPQYTLLFLRRIFIRHHKPRVFAGIGTLFPVRQAVEFHHRAVDFVRQTVAHLSDLFDGFPDLSLISADKVMIDHFYLPLFEIAVDLVMRFKGNPSHVLQIENKQREPPLFGDGGIQLAQRARRTVSRIGKRFFSDFFLTAVDFFKRRVFHIDFASQLQIFRRVGQFFPHVGDHSCVGRDVFAVQPAVSSGERRHETASLIPESQRESVDLRLHEKFRVLAQFFSHIRYPVFHLFPAEHILNREHRHAVAH